MIPITNLEEEIEKLKLVKPWTTVKIAEGNGQNIWLAIFDGEYHWHQHTNGEDIFYVYQGQITIQLKDQADLILKEGDWAAIPPNTEHCPKSDGPSAVIMVEPKNLDSIKTS